MIGCYALGTSMIGLIYLTFGVLSIYLFGSAVSPNILDNVGNECKGTTGGCPWETYVLQVLFLVVLACHIPFVFFSGKEGILIIIDELDRRSISNSLEKILKKHDSKTKPANIHSNAGFTSIGDKPNKAKHFSF